VSGWPEPFITGVSGGGNDINGVATATFTVPDVPPGPYTVNGTCVSDCPVVRAGASVAVCVTSPPVVGGIRAAAFGPYAGGAPFTVLAPAAAPTVPVVVALSTTTG
jgi:hypothetical protein